MKKKKNFNSYKIGIITLCGNNNYGNKLQNYAIVKYLSNQGLVGETIWITNPFKDSNIRQLLRYIKRIIKDYTFCNSREKKFIKFNKLLNINKVLIFNNDIEKIENDYNYFFVGSDQVWNYDFFNNDSIYFLNKFKKEKNVSMSASFGVDNIPKKYHDMYKKGLNNFKYISVREDRGKEIIEQLTNRKDAVVLIDPTMLLSSDEWDKISKKPANFGKIKESRYILNYFLGDLSADRKEEINKIAKKYKCQIINILDKNDPFYQSGPREFLYLEKHAFLICTDSFHSSVFAMLYNRPFVIFDREQEGVENMNSRIDTLIRKFKLKDRKYNGKCITSENLKHDYGDAHKILIMERKKTLAFLNKILHD